MFSLRIVTTDHYISSPLPGLDVQYSDLRGSEVKRVPVFRVFGSTPSGQKTCMHIHGVFPYLYVPYDGTAPWDRYLRQFATSLDKAINVAQGQGQSNQQHVYKIVLVAGMSMYGYQEKDQQFLKIYMYNPQLIRKAADLLLGGAVLNKPFQPHESHIPYTLQLFIDYNLYGMNLINVAAVKFRRRLENDNEKQRKYRRETSPINQSTDEGMGSDPKTPSSVSGLLNRTSSLTPAVKFWDYENIPSDMLLDGDVERQSVCELEVDVVAADVLNRLEVNSNVGANPGLAALWEDERQRRRERGESVDNIAPPQSQERIGIEVADSEQILRERLKQIIQDLQPYMDSQSDTEMDISQEDIMPSAQASQLDLHLSQGDMGGSQDTVTFDLEDDEEEEAVINEASVQHVVSMSESFCEIKPDLQNVTSQDRSLVDILASLAEDTDDPLSQQAIVEAVALEEHDSMLAQTTKPRDIEMDKLEEEEILEMSQKIWDGEDRDVKTTNKEYNIEGMDDSWNESQFEVKPGTSKDIIDEDSEIDSDNDIIPQFDGPGDEKSTRREVKEMVAKRLGMRGPGYNIGQRDIGMIDDNTNHYGQFSSPMGNYGGYPTQQQQSSISMGSIHQRQYPIMSGQQNPTWPGGPMYSQHQTQGMMQQSQRDPGMLQHSPGRIHQSPNPMHHQAARMRHQPGSMHHAVGPMNHSPSAIHQMPTGESSIHPSHGMSPSAANPFNDQPMSMYPSGDHAGFGHQGDLRMKDKDTYGHQMTSYGNKPMMSSMGQSGYAPNYQNSKQAFMQMEHSAHPNNQSNHALAQQNQMSHQNQSIYQQRQDFPSQMMHSQQSTPMNQPFANPSQSHHPYGNQYRMPGHLGSNFDNMNVHGVGQQGIMRQEPGSMKISGMPVSQSQPSFDNIGFKHSMRQQQLQQSGSVFSGSFQEKPVLSQKSTGSQSPRSTNQSPASDISNKVNPQPTASYILKRPQSKGPNPGDIVSRKGASPTDIGFSDVSMYSSCDQQLPLQVEKRLNQSPVMTGYLPPSSHVHSANAYHLNKPVCQNQTSAANYETVLAQGSAQSSRGLLPSSSMNMPGDPLRTAGGGQSSVFPERSPQPSVNVNNPVTGADLFTQKKFSYEQISPPSTPSLERSQSVTITKPTPLSPVASQPPKFDSQLSPLQKLLLEPSADRSSSKTSAMQRSHSRNSVSSVSSVSSEKASSNQNLLAAHQSDNLNCDSKNSFSNMSSPASKSRAESLSDSRLYNLLASDSDTKRKGDNRTPNISNSNKLNDSQQDLFSDSLLSPALSGSGHAHDSNIGNDSLASLFNDSYDSEMNPQSQRSMQHGNKSNVSLPLSIENRSMSGNRAELSKADSLSTLESFVGSVTSDTDYGINFSKGGSGASIQQDNSSLMSAVSDQSFLSQLSSNDLSDLGSFTGQFPAYQAPQTMQHQNSNSYNVANWPEHPQYHNKTSTKRFDGGPPRKRGRPPKNSLSSPGMSVVAAAPGEKKRRGRPRKNSTTVSAAPQNATSPSQNVQKQFSSFQDMSGFLGVNSSQQFQQSPMQQQQQQQQQHQQQQQQHQQQQQQQQQQPQERQKLQYQSNQNFFHQTIPQHENTMNVQSNSNSVGSYNPGLTFMQNQSFPSLNQPSNDFNQFVNTESQAQQQFMHQQNQHNVMQQPQQNYGQSFMSENMSNQGPFLSQGSSNMSTIDASQLFQEEPQQQTQQLLNLDSFGETTKTQEESQKTSTEVSNQEQDFRLTTLQSMKLPNTLVQNNAMHRVPGKHTLSEMWYIPLRRPFPSPAYTYKFRLPKLFCKKLKVSEPNGSTLEVVRMHPKDARKYSLLKIGRETVKLSRLSLEKIERIKAEILKGVIVESIPPPIRNVQIEHFEGTMLGSIQHPIRDVERESFQSTSVGSIQPPIRNVQNESLQGNLVGSIQPPIRNLQNESLQGNLVGSIQPPIRNVQNESLQGNLVGSIQPPIRNVQNESLQGNLVGSIQPPVRNVQIESVRGSLVGSTQPQTCNVQRENTTSHNPIIADLLTCDNPRQGNVIESALVDSAIQNSIQGLHVEKTTVMTVQHMTKTVTTNSELKLEPNVGLGNSPVMKHQRRISEGKERKRNMFKNKNIATIPHLKKYRAGFSYFGKGHVGRGGLHVKVRQSHPVLGPEFEDDSNIVLKDVSLNDGVLTPIKSRTPMAGRSPAHSSGQSMSELECQDKEELDSKLKSLYDLDLQQSQNSQMFNEEEMFVGEDEENSEDDYNSSENGSDEPDGCRKQETTSSLSDKENGQKQSKNHIENKENLCLESVQSNTQVSNDNKGNVDIESIKTKEIKIHTDTVPENCIVKNTKEFKGGKDLNPEESSKVSELKKSTAAEMKTCSESIKLENISIRSEILKDEGSVCGSLNEEKEKPETQVANDSIEIQKSDGYVSEDESNQNVTFYGKFKSHFKEKFAQLNNTEKPDESDKECRLNSDNLKLLQSDPEHHPITRSRSSSCDSRDRDGASLCGSRRSSAARSVESVLLSSESSSVISSCKQSVDNEKKVKRTKRKSISSESRKSSRSSSDDADLKKKSRSAKCFKRKPYNIDLDSDGVPGVDYIVTGKFKGYKEMKVKVKRIEIQSKTDIVNVNEFKKKVDLERNGFHLNGSESHISDSTHTVKEKEVKSSFGFSAEFEKFILSQSNVSLNEKETMIDTDIDERQSKDKKEELCNLKMDGSEVSDVPQLKDQTETQNTEHCANTESRHSVQDSENVTEKIEDRDTLPEGKNEAEKIESTKQNQIGESQFKSSSCPCVNACVCSVKVDNNLPLISTAGLKDFSSTSEDENDMADESFKQKKQVSTVQKFSDVRRKKKSSHRLANAFCGPRGRKKRPQRKKTLKWMSTLDALHDATMENLTANKVYDSADISDHSPVKGKDGPETGSQEQTILLGPDFEVYCDRAVDYDDNYSDTLFRLAYYSPPSSENGNNSSPQPLSPEEMKQMSAENENGKSDKLIEHREQKLTLADIMKSVRSSEDNGVAKESDVCDFVNVQQNKGESDADDESATEHEIKIAIAKEAPMTLKDIKTYCLEEEQHRKKMELSSPPDLGPPVIHKFFTEEEPPEDINLPPNLTPNRQLSNDFESPGIHEFSLPNLQEQYVQEQYDDRNRNHQPPFLTPCRSPRIPLSPRGSPRIPAVSETPKPESRGYFSLPVNTDTNCKVKPGKSPGASSSTGSINVIHSEQFSDISEDENDDIDTSPVIDTQNQKTVKMDVNICGDEKSRDVTEFGERSDMNRNNIFEYLSHPNGVFTDSEDPSKRLKKECITKEQFVRNVELVMTKEPCIIKDHTKINGITDNVTYRHSGYNVKQSHSISNETDGRLSLKQSQHVDKERRGVFDNYSIGNDFWKEGSDSQSQIGLIKRYDHSFNHSNNPLNALLDLHKTHFSQNVNIHSDKDIKTMMDSHSMDLFDSSSDKSSRNGSQNSRFQPMYSRSLSESNKYDYSIVPSMKLNNSIIKSFENHVNIRERSQPNSRCHSMEKDSQTYLEDKGGNKKQSKRQSHAHMSQSTSTPSISSQNNSSNEQPDASSGEGRDHDKGDLLSNKLSDSTNGCSVITPLIPPPSRGNIQQSFSHFGLAAIQSTGPFYSNHRDVPCKPREGGGQVLKVPSTLVKDLEDFNHASSSVGLKEWRTIFCVNDNNVFMSQSDSNFSIVEQLEKQPQLKYALTGDRPVVVCPFDTPPSSKEVRKWCKGRKKYKDLKNQALQKERHVGDNQSKTDSNEKVSGKSEDEVGKVSAIEEQGNDEKYVKEAEKGKKLRLNLFTGKKELCTNAESSISQTSQREHVRDVQGSCSPDADSEYPTDMPKLDMEMDISLTGLPKLDTQTGSPVTGSQRLEEDGFLHSTPLLRRESTELFEPECTPISEEKKTVDVEESNQFVTPKRIKSLRYRRSSSNSDKSLRQTYMNTQLKRQFVTPQTIQNDISQIEGPSLKNSFGFKLSQPNLQTAKSLHEHLTVLSVEVHAESRGDHRPDPEIDAIQAIFYSLFNDVPPEQGARYQTGVFILDPTSANQHGDNKSSPSNKNQGVSGSSTIEGLKKTLLQKSAVYDLQVQYFTSEMEMLQGLKEFITEWDPDILVGYEIQMLSWGYILHRASALSYNLTQAISRVPGFKHSSNHSAERDEWGADYHSEIHIAGRIVLNLWRILRHEVTLNIYSFENVAFHVLHRRIPLYSFKSLTSWFNQRTHHHRWKTIEHYVARVRGILDIMDKLDIIGRTSEFARVFGIEFYHVLSRGTQYRVESMMLRVAKPLNYIPVSPSVHQRARMKAPECIALTLEPESRFYTDPVVILDFQSLYPSIMIAYNYCFSTCLGRLQWFENAHEGPLEFGCTSLNLTATTIKGLEKDVTISPNGVVFCKQSVKRGVLPMMVEEILNTRLMVKKAMSSYKDDKTLTRILHARQMGLKLIANVTYGYTAANFSGRMPCIEVADSIVRKAREALERSIKLVEETPKWGAKVIYGDTDSMFLLFKGRTKDEAFKIGHEIAKTVTNMFPNPIKLKFEKVYLPCVLQTKKRYCGFMYETPDQKDPVFDAKGIETVRRDACSAVSKMLERSIKILFTSKDVSQVKSYVQQQCKKVMEGTVSLQDYIFAKEYRGIPGYKPGACVPALEISKKLLRHDRRSEPRKGERVPYIIVYGSPGLPLIQLVKQPMEVLQDYSLRLNSVYYITKQILPPLHRFLSLLGVDVFSWYHDMPHTAGRVTTQLGGGGAGNKKGTISQYFATSNCPLCDEMTKLPVCGKCLRDPQLVCLTLNDKIRYWERVQAHLDQICKTCTGSQDIVTGKACVSLDCPILYRQSRAGADMDKVTSYRTILDKVFKT